ncbi:MAG: putative membrane protein insertion efficiency factor [bacterium ADurb.Bin400]|nr:MAG: putative membrane protein insertion efficiency factor [bacterium ADurb.Bin400]
MIVRTILIKLIELYQRTLSPDTGWFRAKYPGGYCKFTPHCSEYGKQAIIKYGAVWGGVKAIWRVMRCNPWSKGGEDPV